MSKKARAAQPASFSMQDERGVVTAGVIEDPFAFLESLDARQLHQRDIERDIRFEQIMAARRRAPR